MYLYVFRLRDKEARASWFGFVGHIVIAIDDNTAWRETAKKFFGYGRTYEECERFRLAKAMETYFVFAKLELSDASAK